MKKFDSLNYYELLDVPAAATSLDIRHGYKNALSLYHEESLVTYDLFSDGERAKIIEKIKEAFSTLIDKNSRAIYNKKLVELGEIDGSVLEKDEKQGPIPIFNTRKKIYGDVFFERIKQKIQTKEAQELTAQILIKDKISGADLKKLRTVLGVQLEDIFEVARIQVAILEAIEKDELDKIPSNIYLKNFLKVYSKFLYIDPEKVVKGYLNNIDAHVKSWHRFS